MAPITEQLPKLWFRTTTQEDWTCQMDTKNFLSWKMIWYTNHVRNFSPVRNPEFERTNISTTQEIGIEFSRQKTTKFFNSAVKYARVTSFHKPSALISKNYHPYIFFKNKDWHSDIFGSIHNSNFKMTVLSTKMTFKTIHPKIQMTFRNGVIPTLIAIYLQ